MKKSTESNSIFQFTALFAVILCTATSAMATNMYMTHGKDFEYGGGNIFPVMWDLRSAWFQLRDYAEIYYGEESSEIYADKIISRILTEVRNAGVNTIQIRTEGGVDAQYGTSYLEERADMTRSMGLNVVLGGFGDILDDADLNTAVKNVIEAYLAIPSPPNYAGVIGIHGFDEPDGRYDGISDTDT